MPNLINLPASLKIRGRESEPYHDLETRCLELGPRYGRRSTARSLDRELEERSQYYKWLI